jgi:hypothetical protein
MRALRKSLRQRANKADHRQKRDRDSIHKDILKGLAVAGNIGAVTGQQNRFMRSSCFAVVGGL